MSAPDPLPNPGATPSNSTVATGFGGAVATVIILILAQNHITFPAGMEAALAVIFSTISGYLPKSGRK